MSIEKIEKIKKQISARPTSAKIFFDTWVGTWVYLELLTKHYNNEEINYHELYLKIAHLASRQTLQKIIDKAIDKKIIYTTPSIKDKRKLIIVLAKETILEFENLNSDFL